MTSGDQWRWLPVGAIAVRCRRCGARYLEQTPLPGTEGPYGWHPACPHRWRSAEVLVVDPSPGPLAELVWLSWRQAVKSGPLTAP